MTPPESPVEPLCECAEPAHCEACAAELEAEILLTESLFWSRVDLGEAGA